MRCSHKLEDRVPVCAWCMAVELRQVQDKLATAEDERDEAKAAVEHAENAYRQQDRHLLNIVRDRDEAQQKLAVAVDTIVDARGEFMRTGNRGAVLGLDRALARIRGDKP